MSSRALKRNSSGSSPPQQRQRRLAELSYRRCHLAARSSSLGAGLELSAGHRCPLQLWLLLMLYRRHGMALLLVLLRHVNFTLQTAERDERYSSSGRSGQRDPTQGAKTLSGSVRACRARSREAPYAWQRREPAQHAHRRAHLLPLPLQPLLVALSPPLGLPVHPAAGLNEVQGCTVQKNIKQAAAWGIWPMVGWVGSAHGGGGPSLSETSAPLLRMPACRGAHLLSRS